MLKKSDNMKFDYTITDELGIHARPAGLLVEETKKFESKITISLKDNTVDASSIMKIMMLQQNRMILLPLKPQVRMKRKLLRLLKSS